MKIKYLGQSSFKIETNGKIIITDPYSPLSETFKLPENLSADIVTVTHQHHDHNNVSAIGGDPKVFMDAGEFEEKGIKIHGISAYHDNVEGKRRGINNIFVIESEDLRVCHLGDLGHTLNDSQLTAVGLVDILMIPVGGYYTIGPKEAAEVASQMKPKIILPMHYKTDYTRTDSPLGKIDDFLNELPIEKENVGELLITKDQLSSQPKIVVLKVSK